MADPHHSGDPIIHLQMRVDNSDENMTDSPARIEKTIESMIDSQAEIDASAENIIDVSRDPIKQINF